MTPTLAPVPTTPHAAITTAEDIVHRLSHGEIHEERARELLRDLHLSDDPYQLTIAAEAMTERDKWLSGDRDPDDAPFRADLGAIRRTHADRWDAELRGAVERLAKSGATQ